MKLLSEQIEEFGVKVLEVTTERDEAKNKVRELELMVSVLNSQNEELRKTVNRLTVERDNFLRVANTIVSSVAIARKTLMEALVDAETKIKDFVPIAAPVLSDELEAQLKRVVEGLNKVNSDTTGSAHKPAAPIIKHLPQFLGAKNRSPDGAEAQVR